MQPLVYIFIGLFSGMVSGAFGVGGGIVIVPILVLFFGLTQHQAQGTALTVMLLPVYVLAVLRYYWAGNVKIQLALFIGIGFIFGALIGANFVQGIPSPQLKKAFGIFLILVGVKMAVFK